MFVPWAGYWWQWVFGVAEFIGAFCLTWSVTRKRPARSVPSTTTRAVPKPPDYRSIPRYDSSKIFGQQKQSPLTQGNGLMDNLFGVTSPGASMSDLMHTIQDIYVNNGLLTPSECRDLVPVTKPPPPTRSSLANEEAQMMWAQFASGATDAHQYAMEQWRAMNLVPPHMIGEVGLRVERPTPWPM